MSKHTPGPWMAKNNGGTGVMFGIFAECEERPIFQAVKPKRYYTQYPTRTDDHGNVWEVISTKAAAEAGNYVATDEIKREIEITEEANARLIAQAPRLLEALELCLAAMEHMGNVLNGIDAISDGDEQHFSAFDEARAAIKAAKGESND